MATRIFCRRWSPHVHVRCSPWPSNNVQGTHDSPKFVRATSTSSEAHTGDNQSTGNSPRPVVHMTGHGVNVNPSDVVLFDTHKFVRDLEKAGFPSAQAEHLMMALRDVLTSSLSTSLKGCPTCSELDLMAADIMLKVHTTNNEIDMMKKTEVASVKKNSEEIKEELKRLKGMFQDEMQRIKSGINLDFNLEKSRMRDETSVLNQGIKDTKNSLTTLVADMNTKIESQKLEMIKYLAGGIATIITLMLSVVMGMWRLSR